MEANDNTCSWKAPIIRVMFPPTSAKNNEGNKMIPMPR